MNKQQDVKDEAYAIDFKVVSDWQEGFTAEISITNIGEVYCRWKENIFSPSEIW